MKRALFAGSFNPFTIGHHDIVERTLACLADEVVIAIGRNAKKADTGDEESRAEAIRRLYINNVHVSVSVYDGLTVDFAERIGADFIVRGVRSVKDFEYEREIAEVNRRISGIDTVLFYADPALTSVSSSVVRELQSYGKDVSEWLPCIAAKE